MLQSSNSDSTRQQRRALERAQQKGQATPGPLPLTSSQLAAIGQKADQIADQVAREFMGIAHFNTDAPVWVIAGGPDGVRLSPLAAAKGGLITMAAHRIFQRARLVSKLVAGGALWSVGSGADDIFEHGYNSTGSLSRDVKAGRWHLWIELDGWLLDFSSRLLPAKLKAEHRTRPFSTPPHRWHRFPDVITHDLRRPMPDPARNRHDHYGYHKNQSAMRRLVLQQAEPQRRRVIDLVDRAFDLEGFRF